MMKLGLSFGVLAAGVVAGFGCSSDGANSVGGAGGAPFTNGVGGAPPVGATGTGATIAGAGAPPVGTGATGSSGGGQAPVGGAGVPGVGGSVIGAGGSVVGTAGTGPGGTAGAIGAGGTMSVGGAGGGMGTAGGASGGAGGAGGSGPTLGHCDARMQSADKPLLDACGDITGPDGVNLKLGPYGAIMDRNVGKGFENTDPMDSCAGFASLFNEPAATTMQLLDVGTQPCTATAPNTGKCVDFKLYTVYRPVIWPSGPIPVISWANGTCAQPEGYGTLLRYVASFGFFVVAANSREVGTGKEPLHALDFAAAANADMSSPYYGHLDLTKVGVMGHSQGGQSTINAANDQRVKDVIIFNGGNSASKPFLAISGDMDITGATAAGMAAAVNAAPKGAYLYYHNPSGASTDSARGHLVLMLTPGRVTTPTLAWWQMMFGTDPNAKNQFVGSSCGLCSSPSDYNFGQHGL